MLYCTEKIYKEVGNCHCDNVISSEATKTYKRKARISHFKTLPVSSFALAFPVYIRLVVNTTTTSLLNHALQCVRLDLSKTKFRIVAEKPLLSCDLMYLFRFWDGLYGLIISILDTRLCLTSSTVFQSG